MAADEATASPRRPRSHRAALPLRATFDARGAWLVSRLELVALRSPCLQPQRTSHRLRLAPRRRHFPLQVSNHHCGCKRIEGNQTKRPQHQPPKVSVRKCILEPPRLPHEQCNHHSKNNPCRNTQPQQPIGPFPTPVEPRTSTARIDFHQQISERKLASALRTLPIRQPIQPIAAFQAPDGIIRLRKYGRINHRTARDQAQPSSDPSHHFRHPAGAFTARTHYAAISIYLLHFNRFSVPLCLCGSNCFSPATTANGPQYPPIARIHRVPLILSSFVTCLSSN